MPLGNLFKNLLFVSFCLLPAASRLLAQVAEHESNNTFTTANTIHAGSVKQGTINTSSDAQDYFKTAILADGSVRIIRTATNQGASPGSFETRIYFYGQGEISRWNTGTIAAGQTQTDTLTLYGIARDTIYFAFLYPNTAFGYSFRYELLDTSVNDVEPNNGFNQATLINEKQTIPGHIGYDNAYGVNGFESDREDWFKTKIKADGTVRFIRTITNHGANATSGFETRVFFHNQGEINRWGTPGNVAVQPGQTVKDTIKLHGIAADTIYFRNYTDGTPWSYTMHYELLDTSVNDVEPNNGFNQATLINEKQTIPGHIGYDNAYGVNGFESDREDWFKTKIKADATVRFIRTITNHGANATSGFETRVFFHDQGEINRWGTSGNVAIQPGQTVRDTIKLYGIAADTIYFRNYTDGTPWSYSLSYELIDTSLKDVEPNNDFDQAALINEKQTLPGHVGYDTAYGVNGYETDRYDYFKTLLPADGNVRIIRTYTNNGAIATNGFNTWVFFHNKAEINRFGTLNNTVVAPGQTVRDTLFLYSLAADTIYFRHATDGTPLSYTFRYDVVDTSDTADMEPNNDYDHATLIAERESVKGHSGYRYGPGRDNDDYYKLNFTGTVAGLKIIVSATNTGPSDATITVWAYSNQTNYPFLGGRNIANRNLHPGEMVNDTIVINNCIVNTSGAFIRVQTGGNSFSYRLTCEIVASPIANFGYIKYGNHYSFIDSSKNVPVGTTYQWVFKTNGIQQGTSFIKNPEFDFASGSGNSYSAELTVTVGCAISITTLPLIEAGKISSYSPSGTAVGGEVIINFTGGQFNNNTTVLLKKKSNPSVSFAPDRNGATSQTQFAAHFNLANTSNADAGTYFLEVTFSNGAKDSLPFTLEAAQNSGTLADATEDGENLDISFTGPSFIRGDNLPSIINLAVTNSGSKQAYGVPVWIALPDELTVEIQGQFAGPSGTLFSQVYGTYETETRIRKIFLLMLAAVGPHSTVNIPLIVRQPVHGSSTGKLATSLYTWLSRPMFKSLAGGPGTASSYIKTNWIETFDELQKAVTGRLTDTVCLKSTIIDNGWSFVSNALFGNNLPGNTFTKNTGAVYMNLTQSLKNLVGKCYYDTCGVGNELVFRNTFNSLYGLHLFANGKDFYGLPADSLHTGIPCAAVNTNLLLGSPKREPQFFATAALGFLAIGGAVTYTALGGLIRDNNFNNQWEDDDKNPRWKAPKPPVKKPIGGFSLDPNSIEGPGGYTIQRHLVPNANVSYTIHFENQPTATANAQTVVVSDTLDRNKFNFNSFSLTSFTIGDSIYVVPNDVKEYSVRVGLKQTNAVKAWFYSKFDTITGILFTKISTIDPSTNDIVPFNDERGFLPPNTTAPNGEGSLGYSIAFKQGLSSGTAITNKASIVFDTNAPITTNTWSNVVDTTRPAGGIIGATMANDSTVKLIITGSDLHSGLRMYRIYYSENGTDFSIIGDFASDTVYLIGDKYKSYDFYADVYDSVYNSTNKIPAAEATVVLAGGTYWTGAVSTAWETAGNWSTNSVPISTTDVVIPSGRPRYPIISVNTSIKSLRVLPNTSVKLKPGVKLDLLP